MLLLSLIACNNEKAEDNTTADTLSLEKQLTNEIAKYPDSLLLKENLINYYTDSGDYKNALKIVDGAIYTDSMNPRLWNIKANLHFRDEDTTNAIRSLETAVKIFPVHQYMISLGRLYAQTGNSLALTIADTLSLMDKEKAGKEINYIKGLYYSFNNDKVTAISYFDKCLAANFTFMEAYVEKSIALYDLGKYTEALEVLDKALTLQNNFDEGYYYSGKCLEKLNRIPEAIQSYQNALQIDPDYVEAKEALERLGGS